MQYVFILGTADIRNYVFVNMNSVIETQVGFCVKKFTLADLHMNM